MALELDRVREIAERVAASNGLEVVEIEFRGSGRARMLRVFLDKPGAAGSDPLAGVTHGDCAYFSREFGTILDVEAVFRVCDRSKFKWAGNQEAVTFLGYRPIRS